MKPQSQELAAGTILLAILDIAGLTGGRGTPSAQMLTSLLVQADEIPQP